jgi:hypothetical protein
MRMLIMFLTLLSLAVIQIPGLHATAWAGGAPIAAPAGPRHGVQGRSKKRGPRTRKAKKAEKKPEKPKKNDRGFEL